MTDPGLLLQEEDLAFLPETSKESMLRHRCVLSAYGHRLHSYKNAGRLWLMEYLTDYCCEIMVPANDSEAIPMIRLYFASSSDLASFRNRFDEDIFST